VSKPHFVKKDNYSRCKNSALYSLAMREHSRQELFNKLQKKEFSVDVDINVLLNELENDNYLCDVRFAEGFIRYRSTRGQGPVKISNELRLRGVNNDLINHTIENAEVDWFHIAQEQLRKKYGESISSDFKEKAKRMRFLNNRGFSSDIVCKTVS